MKTINTKIFEEKVQTFKEAGLDVIRVFESDEQFNQWVDSGFFKYLHDNFEHETHLCGTEFLFHLKLHK